MKKELLTPRLCRDNLASVELDVLSENNVKYVWLDIDNTVALWGDSEVSDDILQWVSNAKSNGYTVYLVTNGHKDRVDVIANKLGVGFKKSAGKPYTTKLKRFANELNIADMAEIAVIGDQIFTDVLCANKLGAYSILLKPISEHEWWATKVFNRSQERLSWYYIFNCKKLAI